MSRKYQLIIPNELYSEIKIATTNGLFINEAEFIRTCIRQYLNPTQNTNPIVNNMIELKRAGFSFEEIKEMDNIFTISLKQK